MQLPYTVINVWRGITVWELLTCETSHQSEILHSLIFLERPENGDLDVYCSISFQLVCP